MVSSMLPWELTVPLQVLFAFSTDDGVILDCTVAEEVVANANVRIPPGSPFSLLIELALVGSGAGSAVEHPEAALRLLEHWCSAGVVVEATTSSISRCLVLQHDEDRLELEIV